jgi:putative acetyltransferase
MTVRPERLADADAVRRVTRAAFGRADEADLVDRLRQRATLYLALVAEDGGEVVGHTAFSAVALRPPHVRLAAFGLAPMSVRPDRQRGGVGSALVRAGLAACRDAGADAVFVLGHPAYYPRFGFRPAADHGVGNEYGAPPEAFMVLELTPGALDGVRGTAVYDPALAG